MALFVFTCLDKPNALDRRMAAREAHLAWVRQQPLKLGGPFLDEQGGMAGSLMIFECEDLEAARAISAADPYTQADLWQSVEIRPFKVTVANL